MFTFTQRICVFAMAAVGLFAQSTPVVPAPETRTSGMVGITDGQVARLNVLNPGVAAPAVGVVCTATLSFWDGKGALLKTSPAIVLPGQSQYLDLFGDKDLALTALDRRQIRATITIPAIPPPPSSTTTGQPAACTLIGTLEILNESSSKTEVVLGIGHVVTSPTVAAGNP
ncbi:MAG TPA: hypothetical protein VGP62_04320 [Bryobacteraceae bacterium]|jgi:hypothetical protein|nr:hypothetical protein [Bryobacteraceae bacterium]